MELKVCPRCSSENTAVVSRGLPVFGNEPQGEIAGKETILGGNTNFDGDSFYHCNTCESDFGMVTGHHENSTKRIRFYLGGYSDGYHDLTLVKRVQGASIHYNPPCTAEDKTPIDRRIDDDEWATLVSDIYRCRILDWNTEYVDPGVCDGTLWALKVTFNDKTRLRWEGSNAYPPHLKDLLEVFMKHSLFGDEAVSL